ncbi:hypothetical protein OSTOST_01222, partial [Ostertagia ostertagi]
MSWVNPTSYFFGLVTSSVGIAGNSLLIYMVLKKTPKHLSTYSVLIFNNAICDLAASMASMFVHQRILAAGVGIFYISDGPCCSLFGPMACFVGFGFFLHCFSNGFFCLLYSFCYRYYIIEHEPPKKRTVILSCVLIYSPTFVI